MKLLLVIVALIVAFEADCRHFSDEPTNQVSDIEAQSFSDELAKIDLTNENEEYKMSLRGKSVKSLQKLIKNVETNIVSKLNSIDEKLNNSIGEMKGEGYLKHFPYASNKKTWMDAKAHCESIGGQIWTPVNREDTVNTYKACGTLCWNGWHKNGQGQWVTGMGEVKNSSFWAPNEPDKGEDAVWSSSGGLYARTKTNRYGWTCQM